MTPKDFQVPGEPPVTHIQPANPPGVGPALNTPPPATWVPVLGAAARVPTPSSEVLSFVMPLAVLSCTSPLAVSSAQLISAFAAVACRPTFRSELPPPECVLIDCA